MDAAACRRHAEAVAARDKQREQIINTLGWGLAGAMGIALVCGTAKLMFDLCYAKLPTRRRKQPWEL
jgi:hypothetical protein